SKATFIKQALELAKRRKGLTHQNPTVGAVIVKDGKVIGKGYHKKAGMPHAEVEAINDALSKGYSLENSTIYITLEPCCHHGKTPPCTDAIIRHKIKNVVVATLDPNPLVAGKGIEILKSKGINVYTGVLAKEARKLNEDFFIFIKKKRPFIHLKLAQTLDGKIATFTGSSKWITGEKSREYAHLLRKHSSAVMVGVNTVLKDNPSLTVRHLKTEKQPIRILIDKDLKTPKNFNIFNSDAKTIIFVSEELNKEKLNEYESPHIEFVRLSLLNGKFKLSDILEELYKRDIMHILVEGGSNLITGFLKENLFDKLSIFIAPKIVGEEGISSVGKLNIDYIPNAIKLKREKVRIFDEDVYLELYNPHSFDEIFKT
ncbi:MAG: bifunctional diaminohydroxyphosphoribosylaminopyrimidine deaminase/5-amino-6-(5-phosphoribosylamino)uracil reductase RibD, partial [Hydrogenothermus sp.]